eukprot:1152033-Pelagomonas_calceolata.AAC.2
MAGTLYLTNHRVRLLHPFCNAILFIQGPQITKMTQSGAAGGWVRRLGGQKVGFMPRLIKQLPPNPD